MSDDKKIDDAIKAIGAALTTLVELAAAGAPSDDKEPAKDKPEKSSGKGKGKKKATRKKATAKKSDGPTVDDARKLALELVETVDEFGDEGDDGNAVFMELIEGLFEDEDDDVKKLSDVEKLDDPGAGFQIVIDAITEYLTENYPEEE